MKIEIRRYDPSLKEEWNDFVGKARNGVFLFNRNYLDYHADRFEDCSWIVKEKNKIVAALPANITSDRVLHSHQGLTYGGWILPQEHIDGTDLIDIFDLAIKTWKDYGITGLDYKPLPWIYADRPSQEDLYALWRLNARQESCLLSSTIDLTQPFHYNTMRKRSLVKAGKVGFEIREIGEASVIMGLIAECLDTRHGAMPVHTSAEMEKLMKLFPDNIKAYGTFMLGKSTPDAGTVIYKAGKCAHAQYIGTTEEGRAQHLITPLFDWLLTSGVYDDCRYFDFGTSNEDQGRILNSGLLRQKFSFGATGTAYTRWTIEF